MHRIAHPLEMVFQGSLDMEGAVTAAGFGTKMEWPHGHRAQIDAHIHSKDISDFHIYLCHNDKSFDGCCISGSKSGMILP